MQTRDGRSTGASQTEEGEAPGSLCSSPEPGCWAGAAFPRSWAVLPDPYLSERHVNYCHKSPLFQGIQARFCFSQCERPSEHSPKMRVQPCPECFCQKTITMASSGIGGGRGKEKEREKYRFFFLKESMRLQEEPTELKGRKGPSPVRKPELSEPI